MDRSQWKISKDKGAWYGLVLVAVFAIAIIGVSNALNDESGVAQDMKDLTDAQVLANGASVINARPDGQIFPHPLRVFTEPEKLPGTGLVRFFARALDMYNYSIEVYARSDAGVKKRDKIQAISYRQRAVPPVMMNDYRFEYFLYTSRPSRYREVNRAALTGNAFPPL